MSAGCEHPNATGQRMFIRDGIHLRLCAKCHVIVTKDYADVITARDRTIAELTAERDRLREANEIQRELLALHAEAPAGISEAGKRALAALDETKP